MVNVFRIAISLLTALLAAALLTGCAEDGLCEVQTAGGETPEPAGVVYLRFRMNLPGAGTRAAVDVAGTGGENAIKRVDLLIYDAESDMLVDFIGLDAEQTAAIISEAGVTVPVYVPSSGRARICVSANTPDDFARQFTIGRTGRDFVVSSGMTDYWDVMNKFVPGSDGRQEKLESAGGGIPMTGRFTIGASEEEVIDIRTLNTTEKLSAKMERIVAKVHVLARGKTYDTTNGPIFYANAQDKTAAVAEAADSEYPNWIGWIRLADVHYMPNSVNQSTYLFPQKKDGTSSPRDPNMNLSDYVVGEGLDAALCLRDYIYYPALAMHRENISANRHLADAEGLTIGTTANAADYTRGMYCLENYFDVPAGETDFLSTLDYPLPMVTHISIASQLTPRYIVLLTDYKNSIDRFVQQSKLDPARFERVYGFTQEEARLWENEIRPRYFDREYPLYRQVYNIIPTQNEADAKAILTFSLKGRRIWTRDPADFESDKWPDDTFYVYDTKWDEKLPEGTVTEADKELWSQRYLYFAAGAVYGANADNAAPNPHSSNIRTYAVPHIGGWGYYYTYIDPDPVTTGSEAAPYTKSQVARNNYYIVTVENFGSPGGTITRPEYIKTGTVPVGWNYTGQGNVDLY